DQQQLDEALDAYLAQELATRQAEKKKLQEELGQLDSNRPKQYLHPSLDPVDFTISGIRKAGLIAACCGLSIVLFVPYLAATILSGIAIGITTGIKKLIKGEQYSTEDTNDTLLATVTPALVTLAPVFGCRGRANGKSHDFVYHVLPFLSFTCVPR